MRGKYQKLECETVFHYENNYLTTTLTINFKTKQKRKDQDKKAKRGIETKLKNKETVLQMTKTRKRV